MQKNEMGGTYYRRCDIENGQPKSGAVPYRVLAVDVDNIEWPVVCSHQATVASFMEDGRHCTCSDDPWDMIAIAPQKLIPFTNLLEQLPPPHMFCVREIANTSEVYSVRNISPVSVFIPLIGGQKPDVLAADFEWSTDGKTWQRFGTYSPA